MTNCDICDNADKQWVKIAGANTICHFYDSEYNKCLKNVVSAVQKELNTQCDKCKSTLPEYTPCGRAGGCNSYRIIKEKKESELFDDEELI